MSSLVYLTTRKLKNKFIELLHKPFRLIVTLIFALLMVMNFYVSENAPSGERSLHEFRAIIFIFYIISFITETNKGFQRGGTMFSLTDVNLLFMSPMKPAVILFHGMLSRLGSSLFMGIAFVYQFALLRAFYPVKPCDMIVSVAGYGAVVFVSQLAGALVYFYTCGDKEKIKKARTAFYTVCMIFAAMFVLRFVSSYDLTFSSAAYLLTDLPMRFFPVAGWILTAVDGFMAADGMKILLGVIPCLVFMSAVFALLAFSKHGYYEDVLLSAEKDSDKKLSSAEHAVQVNTTDSQLKKGSGASIFFYKHILENRRTKTSAITSSSIFYLVLIGVYGFVLKSGFISLFALSCTVSIIPVLSGRWIKELTMPHIYLIPASSVKKLFFMLPELLPKFIAESLLQCLLIGFVSGLTPLTVAVMFFTRLAFCFLLTATALLVAKQFREKEKNNVFAATCVFVSGLFSLPSVAVCVAVSGFGLGIVAGFAAMAVVNSAVAFMLLFFARRLLDFTE